MGGPGEMEVLVGAGKVSVTTAVATGPTVRTSPAVSVGTTSAAVTPVLAASPAASGSEEAGGVPTSSSAVALDPLRDPSGKGLPAVHAAGFAVGRLPLPVLEGETVDQAATRRSVTLVAGAAADHFRRHPETEGQWRPIGKRDQAAWVWWPVEEGWEERYRARRRQEAEEEWRRENVWEECTVERIANLWHLLTEARGTVGTGAQAEVLTKWAGNEAGRLLHRVGATFGRPTRGGMYSCGAHE